MCRLSLLGSKQGLLARCGARTLGSRFQWLQLQAPQKTLLPGENGLFFDLSKIAGETLRIIGTGARVFSMEQDGDTIRLSGRGADAVRVHIRLRTPWAVSADGLDLQCDAASRTVLLAYDSAGEQREIILKKSMDW